MNQTIQSKIKDKIQEDISPTRNLSGVHLKIVFGIAILGFALTEAVALFALVIALLLLFTF